MGIVLSFGFHVCDQGLYLIIPQLQAVFFHNFLNLSRTPKEYNTIKKSLIFSFCYKPILSLLQIIKVGLHLKYVDLGSIITHYNFKVYQWWRCCQQYFWHWQLHIGWCVWYNPKCIIWTHFSCSRKLRCSWECSIFIRTQPFTVYFYFCISSLFISCYFYIFWATLHTKKYLFGHFQIYIT